MFRQRKSVLTHKELQRRDGSSLPLHDLVMQTEDDRERGDGQEERGCVSCKQHHHGNEESADPGNGFGVKGIRKFRSEETGVMTQVSLSDRGHLERARTSPLGSFQKGSTCPLTDGHASITHTPSTLMCACSQ